MSKDTENSINTAAGAESAAPAPGGGKRSSWLQNRLLAALCVLVILAAALYLADARRPQFYMTAGQEVETPLGEAFEDPGVYAVLTGRVFGTGKRQLPLRCEGSVDTSRTGSYDLTYVTEYLGREYSCTRRVHVADQKAPVITLNRREQYYVN